MRKKILAMILAMAMILSLAACGGGGSADNQGGNPGSAASDNQGGDNQGSGEEITLEFWTLALQPTFTDFIQGMIDQYESDHPNIKIKWQDLPWDGIQDKFLAQTAGGNPPDVVNIWSQLALTYGSKGALLDLEANATAEQKSIYLESAYDSARLGDTVYALPWYATPNITVYNKALLEEAGITTVPTTYDELFELAIDFHDKTGAYLFTPSTVFHMFYSFGMAAIWVWGRVADRTYWTPVILATRTMSTICLFGWWLLPPGIAHAGALALMLLTAVGGNAAGMSGVNLQYDNCPKEGKTAYLGLTAALASLIGYGVSLLGSSAQNYLAGVIGSGPSMAALFCFSGVLSLISLIYGMIRLPRTPHQ